jgi:hypothetical protein
MNLGKASSCRLTDDHVNGNLKLTGIGDDHKRSWQRGWSDKNETSTLGSGGTTRRAERQRSCARRFTTWMRGFPLTSQRSHSCSDQKKRSEALKRQL